jgi:hypothetical protein
MKGIDITERCREPIRIAPAHGWLQAVKSPTSTPQGVPLQNRICNPPHLLLLETSAHLRVDRGLSGEWPVGGDSETEPPASSSTACPVLSVLEFIPMMASGIANDVVECVGDLIRLITRRVTRDNRELWFRGQRCSSWDVEAFIWRTK